MSELDDKLTSGETELEARLREILKQVADSEIQFSDKLIAQILQAVEEAGYIRVANRPMGNAIFMTGQEWYDKVDKAKMRSSIKNMVSTYNQFTGGERGLELLWPLIDKEIKRAAGLKESGGE